MDTTLNEIMDIYSGEKVIAKHVPVKIFGLIVYTDRDPFLIKCLRDDDYWKSLDLVSGQKWVILSVKPKPGSYETPETPKSGFGFLVPIWKEPADNEKILDFLNIESTKDLPLLFVMNLNEAGEVLMSAIKITGKTPEETYVNLQNLILELTAVIERIKEENYENSDAIFGLMKGRIESLIFFEKAKGSLNRWKEFKDIFL